MAVPSNDISLLFEPPLVRSRSLLRCTSSEKEGIGGYTPSDYIEFNTDKPEEWCRHRVSISVDAPIPTCFGFWNQWGRLIEFMDLIGTVRTCCMSL
jgi:hypothetical protein